MYWEHSVSPEWLEARKEAISATELISLIPDYKRWVKAGSSGIAPAFAALWAEKTADGIPDVMSYGAAARGHIMEPYAVEEFNKNKNAMYYHWDDCFIINNGAGFSPDALDVRQPDWPIFKLYVDGDMLVDTDGEVEGLKPSSMLEIKSYEPKHHVKNMLLDKMELPERMQIAHAMMVIPSINLGQLVFFCPQAKHQMYTREYHRSELEDDIAMCNKILDLWNKTVEEMEKIPVEMTTSVTEKLVHDEWSDYFQF